MRTPLAITLLLVLLAVPTALAAESATPKNAAQWCTAWKNGTDLGQFAVLYPGGLGYAKTFEQKRGNGLAKKNLFGRCVSLTATKLAAAKAAVAGEVSTSSRCKADIARGGSAYSRRRKMRVGRGTVDPALGVLHGCAHPTVGGGGSGSKGGVAGGRLPLSFRQSGFRRSGIPTA